MNSQTVNATLLSESKPVNIAVYVILSKLCSAS